MNEIWSVYILPCVCAFLACLGFTLVFNIHGAGKLICGMGGSLGWLIYLLGGNTIFAAFWASAAIGLFAEIMARLRRCPVTGYLLVALLPLVPGGGIYYAMSYCVSGNIQQFLTTLLHTFGMAAALAVGAMMTSSLFRAVYPHLHRP
ncbi:threonine/serine exporter family protein [Oscillospiraceae bacterium 50-58]